MKHIGWLVVVGSSVVLGSLAYGQIRLPEDTRSDVQKIQQLHITDDALPVRSDYTNAVMLLNSDPFNTQGTSGVSDTHDDYIWIPKGAISDGSIWPEDIEGGVSPLGLQEGSCVNAGGVAGFGADGVPQCRQGSVELWKTGNSSVYRDDSSYSIDSSIYIGCEGQSCMADSAGVSDAVITVKGSGITRIGADSSGNSRLSLARSGGIRGGVISTNASSVSLNTPVNNGTRTIVLGKDASDRLGVGTDAPQSTLHVVGDTVVDGGSWTISSDNSASPANSLVMSHTAAGGRLSATTPIVISKDNNGSKLTTMRDSIDDRGLARFWSRDAYAVGSSARDWQVDISMTNTPPAAPGVYGTVISVVDHSMTSAQLQQMMTVSYTCATGTCTQPVGADGTVAVSLDFGAISEREIMVSDGRKRVGGVWSPNGALLVANSGELFGVGLGRWQTDLNPVHVAISSNPQSPISQYMGSTITVGGSLSVASTAQDSKLRFANLSPSNKVYKTLKDVNCKLLTVDSDGHFQLVDYMRSVCDGGTTPPPSTVTYARACSSESSTTAGACSGTYGASASSCTGTYSGICSRRSSYHSSFDCASLSQGDCFLCHERNSGNGGAILPCGQVPSGPGIPLCLWDSTTPQSCSDLPLNECSSQVGCTLSATSPQSCSSVAQSDCQQTSGTYASCTWTPPSTNTTQTVVCKDNNNNTVADSFCSGTKPSAIALCGSLTNPSSSSIERECLSNGSWGNNGQCARQLYPDKQFYDQGEKTCAQTEPDYCKCAAGPEKNQC